MGGGLNEVEISKGWPRKIRVPQQIRGERQILDRISFADEARISMEFPRGSYKHDWKFHGGGRNEVEIPKGWPENLGFLNRGVADKNWNGPYIHELWKR